MELNSNRTIQFANVGNNETFTFPLIIVKGCIFENEGNSLEGCITADYLDTDGNIIKQINSKLLDKKFSFLLDLKLGENEFVFKYKTTQTKITFHHISPSTNFVVSPVYIICSGEKPRYRIENIKKKILVGCSLIQTLIAETLYQCGFERKTFSLNQSDANGNDSCLIFYSKLNIKIAANMTSEELWEYFGREIMTSEHGFQHRKFLSFLSNGKSKFSQHLAIGGGGLALCSAEYIDTWPESIDEINHCFVDETSTNFMHTNNINRNYGNSFSASLGAVCHELCHTFDLGHTIDGIMGRDFDRVGIIFSLLKYDAVRQETEKLQNFNCIKSKKDSLIICEGTCCRKMNINYSVNNNLSQNFTRNLLPKKCDFNIENITYREKTNINDIFPRILFWSNGCATLLAHHKWLNQVFFKNKNNINSANSENEVLQYDSVRNIVTSKFGIVVVQLRNHDGYVLKSWEFSERRKKTLFLVPICESRKADSIVIEDFKGNIIKKDIKHFLNDTKP